MHTVFRLGRKLVNQPTSTVSEAVCIAKKLWINTGRKLEPL